MRVLDASGQVVFAGMCKDLAEIAGAAMGKPDVILGIRSGGAYVAEAVACHFPEARLGYITSRRPSTGKKGKLGLKRLLRYLPVALLDALRILEARLLARSGNPERKVAIDISQDVRELMAQPSTKILLVDDAVDSGYTLRAVVDTLSALTPGRLFTAAITSTTSAPVMMPDFLLYNDNVLVRFPWSMDARH